MRLVVELPSGGTAEIDSPTPVRAGDEFTVERTGQILVVASAALVVEPLPNNPDNSDIYQIVRLRELDERELDEIV